MRIRVIILRLGLNDIFMKVSYMKLYIKNFSFLKKPEIKIVLHLN